MALVVVTGGARSGKSAVAAQMAGRCAGDIVAVVFGQAEGDTEMAERIARHKAERPVSWKLVEAKDSVEWTERVGDSVLLLDCLGSMLGRVMDEVACERSAAAESDATTYDQAYSEECEKRFAALIAWLVQRMDHTIIVTNEVGDSVVPAFPSARLFRDILGRANRSLVGHSNRAYLVVAGRLIDLLELPTEGSWPWHEKGCD